MNEINIKKEIGARMRQLRLEIGLTQEELANKLVSVKGKVALQIMKMVLICLVMKLNLKCANCLIVV